MVSAGISIVTPPPPPECVDGLTWSTLRSQEEILEEGSKAKMEIDRLELLQANENVHSSSEDLVG